MNRIAVARELLAIAKGMISDETKELENYVEVMIRSNIEDIIEGEVEIEGRAILAYEEGQRGDYWNPPISPAVEVEKIWTETSPVTVPWKSVIEQAGINKAIRELEKRGAKVDLPSLATRAMKGMGQMVYNLPATVGAENVDRFVSLGVYTEVDFEKADNKGMVFKVEAQWSEREVEKLFLRDHR